MASRFHHKNMRWRAWVANVSFKPMKLHTILQVGQRPLKSFLPILFLISFITVVLSGTFAPALAQFPQPLPIPQPPAFPQPLPLPPSPQFPPATTGDIPQPIPTPIPIPQPIPQPIPGIPQPIPQPIPGIPQPIPQPVPQPIPQPVRQRPRQEIRGVWMTNNDLDVLRDRAKVQKAMTQLRRLNFNTVSTLR